MRRAWTRRCRARRSVKNVGFRDLNGRLSCIVGIGRALWDRLSPGHRPLDLLAFVDGTANPTGAELPDAALIGEDADPDFAGRADPDAAGRAGDGGPGA